MLKYTSQSGSTLFAQLPIELANALRPSIQDSLALGNTTAVNLQKDIYYHGNSSKVFLVLQDFLANLFGTYAQTTIVNDAIYIGNGLQLSNNPTTKALFLMLDPTRDWDFNNLFSKPGYPVPALNADEISNLTYLSITGVNNTFYGKFTGYLPNLIDQLGDFSQKEFSTNQLLGLLTAIYNTNSPLPSTMQDALNFQLDYEPFKDLAPLMCIVEYINSYNDPFFANLCLGSGAMYLGEPDQKYLGIHSSFRILERIKTNYPSVQIQGSVYWGIPIGDADFPGMNNITTIPSFNPDVRIDDSIIFGTPVSDQIQYDDPNVYTGSLVILAGKGNNNFSIVLTPCNYQCEPQFLYMSGQGGFNSFTLQAEISSWDPLSFLSHYALYLRTGDGLLQTNYSSISMPIVFGGPIVDNIVQYSSEISPFPNFTTYNVTTTEEDNGTQTLHLNNQDAYLFQPSNISISDYIPGKLRLLSGGSSINLNISADRDTHLFSQICNKGFALVSSFNPSSEPIFSVYNIETGRNINNITMNGVVVNPMPMLFTSTENGVMHMVFQATDSKHNTAYYYANMTSPYDKTITPSFIEYSSNRANPFVYPMSLVSLNNNTSLFLYCVTNGDGTVTCKVSFNGAEPIVVAQDLPTHYLEPNYSLGVIDKNRFWANFCSNMVSDPDCRPSLYDSSANFIGNFSFPTMQDPTSISWETTPLENDNGYVVCSMSTIYESKNVTFQIYNEETGWSKPIINPLFTMCGPLIQLRNNYWLFMESSSWMLDQNYNIAAGPFQIFYGENDYANYFLTSYFLTTQGDVVGITSNAFFPYPIIVVNLTTSALSSKSNSHQYIPEKSLLNSFSDKVVINDRNSQGITSKNQSLSVNSTTANEKTVMPSLPAELPPSETNTQTFNVPVQKSEASELAADILVNADRVSRWTSDVTRSVVGFFSRTLSSATSKATDVLKSARDYVRPDYVEKDLTLEQLEKLQLYIDDVARLRKSASYLALQGYEYYAAELDELSARAEKYLGTKRASLAELKDLTYQSSYWTRQYVQPCESRIYHDPFHARWQQWNLAHPKFAINATEISVAKIQTTLFGASANSSTLNNATLPMISAGAAVRYLGR